MLDGKTMPHSDLARLVVHFNILLSKIGKTEQARPPDVGVDGWSRRSVRDECAVEEREDLAEEWLECGHRQGDESRADFGHFDGEQAVVAPRLICLYNQGLAYRSQ